MPQSSAERQRTFIARKKVELGDGFNAWIAAKRRSTRQRSSRKKVAILKAVSHQETLDKLTDQLKKVVLRLADDSKSITLIAQQKQIELEIVEMQQVLNCADLKEKLLQTNKKNGKQLAESTVNNYIGKTNTLYRKMHNRRWDCKTVEWLEKPMEVIAFIKEEYKLIDTQATYLSHIAGFVMRVKELQDVFPIYDRASKELNKLKQEKREDQELKPEWQKLIITWPEAQKIVDKVSIPFDKAMIGLFTLIAPRRSGLLFDLKYRPKGYDRKEQNFITDDGFMVLGRYKTYDIYGKYRVKLPKKLMDIFKKHILVNGVKYGDLLFYNQQRKGVKTPYSHQSSSNNALRNVMFKYTHKRVGSTLLRIAYATHHLIGKGLTLAQQRTHAIGLGHSVPMLQSYSRVTDFH